LTLGRDLLARLEKLARPDPPFAMVPAAYRRGARWTVPQLVVEIAFTSWTTYGALRNPSFEGIREDKAAQDVRLERPRPSARTVRTTEV
jgi:bifunctional non-homologous end joining protein LigD